MKAVYFFLLICFPFLGLAQQGTLKITGLNGSYIDGKAGNTFSLNIEIGNPVAVTDLVGISFHLNWDHETQLHYESSVAGTFCGSNPMVVNADFSSHAEIGIASSSGGHSGTGLLARFNFTVVQDVADLTPVSFTVSDLTAIDVTGNPVELSTSNSPFILYLCKEIPLALTSANGNEYWQAGTTKKITWTEQINGNVKLEYSIDAGVNWMTISESVPAGDKSFDWVVADTPSENCLVKITSLTDNQLFDLSEHTFTIYPAKTTIGGPYYSDENTVALLHFDGDFVNTENPDNSGLANNTVSFQSSFDASHGSCVKIDNTKSDVFSNVEIPDQGSLTLQNDWTIEFWFKISSWGSATVEFPFMFIKTGANYFIMLDPSTKTLHAGYDYNGGAEQVFLPNNSLSINTWYHVAFVRNTSATTLKCLLHDINRKLITSASAKYNAAHLPKTNTDPVRIGGFSFGSNCQFNGFADELRISKTAREFRSLELLSLNAGGSCYIGDKVQIKWNSADIDKLKFEYSTNNGTNWTTVSTSLQASSGTYIWTVPDKASTACKIRLSDANDATFSVVSSQTFTTVKAPSLKITKPDGGETWDKASTQNITWTAESVTVVKLEYSTDGGVSWNLIAENIDATLGSFSWKVPDSVLSHCLVRISNQNDTSLNDVSNQEFSIEIPSAISELKDNGCLFYQNIPNPFAGKTKLKFELTKTSVVTLEIIDMNGKVVTRLINKKLSPGTYSTDWDATFLPSGIYLGKLKAGQYTYEIKLILK